MLVKARKLAVVGSRSVGKSSMTVRFVEDHFVESYYPTIENQFSKHLKLNNQDYNIEILDTAGQDEFSLLNEKHLIGIHGYILIYSVTSRQSFEIIEIIRDKILNSIGSNVQLPMILIGNKCDLNYQRQVEFSEGQELANRFNCKFLETSVRENLNVDKCFRTIIEEIEKIQNPPPQKQEDKCAIM
ncbi:GTP-binding protein rhb1 [Candida viswanathii]|uniref:GTP-binding protein rhb1 n=1 Tax=Candida viswanathii TaxID=5486 RepID=A0A367YFK3_9ASCO|nr:GTP-binding protein rhb1 [Candida viswanathii]